MDSKLISIEKEKEIELKHEKFKDWDFFWNVEKMMSSKELDMMSDRVKVNRLPDMFYGFNRFYLINSSHNFVLEINPLHMIDLSSFKEREKKYLSVDNLGGNTSDENINVVYYNPPELKVQHYNTWKDLKIEREDVKTIEPIEDWSFSSSYMGTASNFKDHNIFENLNDYFADFDLFKTYYPITRVITEEGLPISRLGPENVIYKYMEMHLFDDELNDNGLSQGSFR